MVELNKTTVWYLSGLTYVTFIPGVRIADDAPDYVIDWFKKNRPNCEFSDYNNEEDIECPIPMDRWPTKEEMTDETLYALVTPSNVRDYYKLKNALPEHIKAHDLHFNTIYVAPPKEVEYTVDNHKYEFCQWYLEGNKEPTANYRRHKLRKYLEERFDYHKVKETETCRCKYLIISMPQYWELITNIVDYDILIYDRSDYWGQDTNVYEENQLIKEADIVINSTDFLLTNSRQCLKYGNVNNFVVYNGATVYDCPKLDKINKYVYIGRSSSKVDWDFIGSLDKKVDVYGDFVGEYNLPNNCEYKGWRSDEDLSKILPQYQAGIIANLDTPFTRGMLPIKLFNYLNAGLEVITHNCIEADNYIKYRLGEPYDWTSRFDKMLDYIKNAHIGDVEEELFNLVRRPEDEMSIWWSISKACNFKCPYCCQRDKRGWASVDIDKVTKHLHNLMVNSKKFKKFQISILGGEPALFDLYLILKNLSDDKYHLKVNLLTNCSLKDADWWNGLHNIHPNTDIEICASFHPTEVKDYKEWFDKVAKIKNAKPKFVVGNSNFEEVKKIISDYNLTKYTLEGMRDFNHFPLFSEEIAQYIRERGNTQTDQIKWVHDINPKYVDCYRRLAIRGETIQSGCKLKEDITSIYDLKDLDWKYTHKCKLAGICNICMAQSITNIIN